jgi:rhomboid protease GluP
MQGQVTFGRKRAALEPAPAALRTAPTPLFPVEEAAPREESPVNSMPFATITILVFLALLFVLELTDKPTARPGAVDLASLIHLGAVSRDFVLGHGQVWRLLTAPWLHLDLAHIIGNGIALVVIGFLLEPIIGWRWFAAVYTLGGIGGALGSIFLKEGSIVSVGASGAILAVIACAGVMSMHPASVDRRMRIWRMCAFTGVPALIPHAGSRTDYSAHAGGAMVGLMVGWVLLNAWDHERRRPPLEGPVATTGTVIGFLGVVAVAVAALLPPSQLHAQTTAGLVPPDEQPSTGANAEGEKRWSDLEVSYPQDPRTHVAAAAQLVKNAEYSKAEGELQTALASPLLHAPELQPVLEQRMRIALVGVQLKQNEVSEARQSAKPLCPSMASFDPKLQDGLKALKACDGQ